jgi:hypothetical protein
MKLWDDVFKEVATVHHFNDSEDFFQSFAQSFSIWTRVEQFFCFLGFFFVLKRVTNSFSFQCKKVRSFLNHFFVRGEDEKYSVLNLVLR